MTRKNEIAPPTKEGWKNGYQAGKTRARYEVLAVVVALYFIVALIGNLSN